MKLTKAQHKKIETTPGLACLMWVFLTEDAKKKFLETMKDPNFQGDLWDAKVGSFDGTGES